MAAVNVFKLKSILGLAQFAADPTDSISNGFMYYNTTANTVRVYQNGAWGVAAPTSFDDSTFTIQNHSNATKQIAFSAAAITASTTRTITMPDADVDLGKVASAVQKDGSVSMTGALDMNSHKITNLAAPSGNGDALRYDLLGANSGIATLDSGGKIPTSQLPNSVMEYQGTYDPTGNSGAGVPALADGTGNRGDVYKVTVAGSHNFGSGAIAFVVGDYAIYNGTVWEKAHSGADAVISVNGKSSAVTLVTDDIAEGTTPTNKWFTEARAIGSLLAGFSAASGGTITSADSILSAIGKLEYRVALDDAKVSYSASTARSDLIASSISSGDTTHAPDGNSVYSALAGKLSSVAQDTTPQLGGDLDLNSKVLKGIQKIGDSSANYMEQEYINSVTLTGSASGTTATALSFAVATFSGATVEYKVVDTVSGAVRIGQLMVAVDASNSVAICDTMSETADVGLSWDCVVVTGSLHFNYTTTANNKTLRALVKRIKV